MHKSKTSSQFVCNQCGYESVQWYGKCPNCGQWNTMVEFRINSTKGKSQKLNVKSEEVKPLKLSEVKTFSSKRFSSGIEEFDRVLGGSPSTSLEPSGFVPGSVILLAGEPGVGKSTLLLQLVKDKGKQEKQKDQKVLYVCGEESVEQLKMRAERLGVKGENLFLLAETNVENIIEEVRSGRWEAGERSGKLDEKSETKAHISHLNIQLRTSNFQLLIIDSIQTLWSEEIEGYPGSISQVRGCAQKLIEFAKKNCITTILVGHITKEGEVAGPMMLAHMVDVVLFLEGERFTELRLLRGLKNRFGPTDEVGVFRMTEKGMEEVENPSELFLGGFEEGKGVGENIGNVVVCAMEGTRPMLVEVQALVTQSALAIPRRVALGVDYNRVLLLSAVLQKSLNLALYNQDIIVKVAGGFKISEPAADLGICLAIISSFKNQPVLLKTCVFGEVGLLGEIRRVGNEEKRKKEAKKLGFTKILSSETVRSLQEAIKVIGN